jgi:hypothetical protein
VEQPALQRDLLSAAGGGSTGPRQGASVDKALTVLPQKDRRALKIC